MKLPTQYLIAAVALGTSFAAHADSFYCGENLIEEGMSQDKVVQLCGEPSSRDGNNWIYDRSPEKFKVRIYFEADETVGDIQQEMLE